MLNCLPSDTTCIWPEEGEGNKCNGRTQEILKGSGETCRKIKKCITNDHVISKKKIICKKSLREKKNSIQYLS